MVNRRITLLFAAITLLACLLLVNSAIAAGGVYLDNFQITNNGTVAFTDGFESGNVSTWTKTSDLAVVSDKPKTPPYVLCLNKHIFCAATAYHSLSITNPGLIEMSMLMYVTPPEEQYDYQKKNVGCNFFVTLYSGKDVQGARTDQVGKMSVQLVEREKGCRLGVTWKSNAGNAATRQPVMQSGKWCSLLFRMDPKTRMMSISLDGRVAASCPYDPSAVTSISEVGIASGFGDGSKRTD